jgi:hypothetical protein
MLPTPQRTAIIFSSARPTRERNPLQTEHESRRAEDWGGDCHHVEEEFVGYLHSLIVGLPLPRRAEIDREHTAS